MSFKPLNDWLSGIECLDKLPALPLSFDEQMRLVGGVNDAPVNGVFDKEHSIPKFDARHVCDQIRSFFIKQSPVSHVRQQDWQRSVALGVNVGAFAGVNSA